MHRSKSTRFAAIRSCLLLTAAFILCVFASRWTEQMLPAASLSGIRTYVSYLNEMGWEVGESVVDTTEIPDSSDPGWDTFFLLQSDGGFDPTAFSGCTVTRLTVPILNYPTGETHIYADLLIHGGEVIGGDLRCTDLDGFILPLLPRDAV